MCERIIDKVRGHVNEREYNREALKHITEDSQLLAMPL